MWSHILLTLGLVALGASAPAAPPAPQVNLGYARYEGTRLSNGVDQFLGMRYAAPPTGDLRFRLPEPPLNASGVTAARSHGPLCYGVTNPSLPPVPSPYSEDCLYIDVYAPANATSSSNLPVMLWIQGGGLVQMYNPNYNGTGLIEASHGQAIVVTFNYRVGPYGFLANSELESEGNLNLGLHDQRAAMRWVQQHISSFGGDPNKVTLFGTSVGGGSVLLQLLAYGGNPPVRDAPNWSAGIAESAYLPSFSTVQSMEFQYEHLLQATNCTSLACLRALPIATLQAANNAIPFPGQNTTALFGYGPVIDGSLFPDLPYNLLHDGRFAKNKPLIIGNSVSEGTLFAAQANTTAEVNTFMQAQYPNLTSAALHRLNTLYADTPATYPGVNAREAPLYYRAAAMFGDAPFTCSSLHFARALTAASVPVHLFRNRIVDPVELAAGLLVPHTWEVQAVWGPEFATQYVALAGADSYLPGGVNAAIVPVVQAYWTSFAQTLGDPNRLKSARAPVWEAFGAGRFLTLQTNATRMGQYSNETLARCEVWDSLSAQIGQ